MKRILNVGCGNQTHGTDFIDLYPQRKEVIKCDIEKHATPYPDETFDEVYSRSMFEHMKNPNIALNEMARVLKKGGVMTVIADNANHLWFALPDSTHSGNYKREGSLKDGDDDKHYCLFTGIHLVEHFKSVGLTPVSIRYIPPIIRPRLNPTGINKKNIGGKIYYFIVYRLGRQLAKILFGKTRLNKVVYPNVEVVGVKE